MVLEPLISLGYSLIEYSWIASTYVAPVYLAAILSHTAYENSLDWKAVLDNVEEYGPVFAGSIVLLGVLLGILQASVSPVFSNLTQPAAFLLLAFLFYRF